MAKDSLEEAGSYFDELKNLIALEPDVSQKTSELKEGSKDFVDKIDQFQKIDAIRLIDELAKEVEKEKRKYSSCSLLLLAIAARNLWRLMTRQREAQQQQLQALIAEKKSQLERFLIKYAALSKMESEQNELIDQFI
ncbi:intraflagellar transport protein 20 homolog [Paralichthys olivaceus]|uniref:intraflagellar transport protein 20 homolog n=1 Tax=Paralichthys olivaceus TaxID=8255 RepID=UPI0037535801